MPNANTQSLHTGYLVIKGPAVVGPKCGYCKPTVLCGDCKAIKDWKGRPIECAGCNEAREKARRNAETSFPGKDSEGKARYSPICRPCLAERTAKAAEQERRGIRGEVDL